MFLYSYFLCTKLHRVISSSDPRGKGSFTVLPNHEVAGIVRMLWTLAVRAYDDCTSRYIRLPSLRKSSPLSLDRRMCVCVCVCVCPRICLDVVTGEQKSFPLLGLEVSLWRFSHSQRTVIRLSAYHYVWRRISTICPRVRDLKMEISM
jgi:hypothetical protein